MKIFQRNITPAKRNGPHKGRQSLPDTLVTGPSDRAPPGLDNIVHVVAVRVNDGLLKRTVSKVFVSPRD